MFVSGIVTMNDATIREFLKNKLDTLARDVKIANQDIRGLENAIDDKHNKILLLKIHYTSLLNTALAYGLTEEQIKESGYDTLEPED